LCGDELEDLKIADFGLSKMVLPKEKMDAACGTLSYVAPEVLTMQGYGMEADLWSVGVIMFLLMCGKLPFDGDDSNEIIRSTIQGEFKVNQAIWSKLSDESKDLMTKFLNKNPKERCSAREALKHPFFAIYNPHPHKHRASVSSDQLPILNQSGFSTDGTPSSSPSSSPIQPQLIDQDSGSDNEGKAFKPIV
jgi:serine/threonine protein kinase